MIDDAPATAADPLDSMLDEALGPTAGDEKPPRPRLTRLALKRGQRASEVIPEAELDAVAKKLEERSGITRASFPAKVAAGAVQAVGDMAKFPKVVVESAKALGVNAETIHRHAPFIEPVARFVADAANVAGEAGQGLQDLSAQYLEDPRFAPQDTVSQFGRALGSSLPFGAAGLARGAVAKTAATILMGGAQNSVGLYEDILAETRDPKKAMAGALLGFAIGSSEAVGAGGALAKLDTATGGSVRAALKRMAFEGIEEGGQELVQTIANGVSSGVIKGKDLDALKILAEGGQGAGIGLLVGSGIAAGLQGAGTAARALPGQPTQAPGAEGEITPTEETFLGVQEALRKPPGGGIRYQGEGDAPRAAPKARTVADIGPETAPKQPGAAGEPKEPDVTTAPTGPEPAAPGAHEAAAKAILGDEEVTAADMTPEAIRIALEAQAAEKAKAKAGLERMAGRAAREQMASSVAADLIDQEESGEDVSPLKMAEPFFAKGGAFESMNPEGRAAFQKQLERHTGIADLTPEELKSDFLQGMTFRDLRTENPKLFGLLMQMVEAQRQHEAGTNPFTSPAAGLLPGGAAQAAPATEPVQGSAGTGAAGEVSSRETQDLATRAIYEATNEQSWRSTPPTDRGQIIADIEHLEELNRRGRLRPEALRSTEFWQKLSSGDASAISKAIEADPAGTLAALRKAAEPAVDVSTGPQRVERRKRDLALRPEDIAAEERLKGMAEVSGDAIAKAKRAEMDPKLPVLNASGDQRASERVIRVARSRPDTKAVRIFADLADLTSLNNLFDHDFADEVIGAYVDAWKGITREGEGARIARIGGDEFATTILVPKDFDPLPIVKRAEAAAQEALKKYGLAEGAAGRVFGVDVGWAEVSPEIGDPRSALKEANKRADAMSKERKQIRAPGKRKPSSAEAQALAPAARIEREGRLAGTEWKPAAIEALREQLRELPSKITATDDQEKRQAFVDAQRAVETQIERLSATLATSPAAADEALAPKASQAGGGSKQTTAGEPEAVGSERLTRPETAPSIDDIPKELANSAFQHISHTPERRGTQIREEYVQAMRDARRDLAPLATNADKLQMLSGELEKYRQGYIKRLRNWLAAQSRVASPMITGPANFPTRANEKRGATADKRRAELDKYRKLGIAAIRKALTADERAAKTAEKYPGREARDVPFDGGTVRLNLEADRVQLLFDERPGAEMHKKLRGSGFKWAPSVKAWQRQWTPNAERATEQLLGIKLDKPAKVDAARVRTVHHPTRGEIEVRGSGAATYWRDPGDATSPFAGRFLLASPEFRAEIEKAASAPPKPSAEEAREQARIAREVESARKHNESVDREREAATREKLSPAERAEAIVAAYKPQPEPESRPPSAAPKAALPPGVRIAEEEGEVRVYFEKKPDTNYLKKLRAAGYKWSGAMKAWHRPLAGGRHEAAAELFGVSHEGMTATERLADYERRVKDLNAAMKGKRSVARRGLQFQIRTLDDQIEKVKPAADAERRASEESNRRLELAKLHAKGARTEIVLGHMAYAEIPEQAEALAAMRAWAADEAGKAGVKGEEADALENEALRFYATGGDLTIGRADDYSMGAFVRKAIGPLRLSRGIAELNAQIDAARKEAAAAVAPFDDSMHAAIDRIKREMSGKPESEILEALQKDIRSRIGQQRISTQTRQAEKIRKESAEEEARWQTLIDDTSEWTEFAAAGNPYVKAAWDGGFHTADESIASDGREMIRLDAIETKAGLGGKTSKALQFFQKKSEGVRYGASNPLPKTATDHVWNSAVKADGKKAEVAAVVGPASDNDYTLAFLRRQDGQFVAVDAHRLRAIFRATKADGILVSKRDNPVVVTKAGKPVAIVMPITIGTGNESPRAKFIHEAIGKGGVSEIRRAARARLEEAKAARDKELAALGAKAEPEPEVDDGDSDGIEEMMAFPGALMPDVKEAIDWTFKKLGYIRAQRATVAGTISTEDLVERQIRRFQDSFRGIKTLQKDIEKAGGVVDEDIDTYLAEELRKGQTKVRLEDLDSRSVRPLLKGLRKDGISPEEFGEALMARHAPERNEVIRKRDPKNDAGSGLTDEEAAAIMERVENGKRAEGFARAFARFDAMIEHTREGWVRDGLMSQKDVDELRERFQFYAPLRSDLSEGPDDSPFRGTGRGVDVRGGEFKAALGRSTRAEARDVLAYAFTQAQTSILRGEKNKVAQTFLNLVRANEPLLKGFAKVSPKQIKKALVGGVVKHVYDPKFKLADNVIAVHEDGEVVWVEIDPRFQNVADGLKNLGAESAGALIRHLGGWTRYLAGVNTRYNPVFPLFNALRDAAGAFINSQEHGLAFASRTVRDVPLALWALTKQKLGKSGGAKWDRLAAEYRASGAPVAFLELRSFEDQAKLLESELARQRAGGKAQVRRGWRAMLNTISAANDVVENAVRFSAYVHAREDLGMSAKRAASWSKNLTVNFERKGDAGATLNALFMFANASIQSTARVGQAVRHPGVQRLLGAAFIGAMAWDQIMRAIGGEDDDGEDRWDKIPSYIKRHNLVVMRPDGTYITIPTPFVYDWLQTAAHQLSGFISGDVKAGDALGEIASAAIEAFDPIGSGNLDLGDPASIARTISPTVIDPIVELATNRDWKGDPIVYDKFKDEGAPDSADKWPDPSSVSKSVVEWLNKATGGDKFEPGMVDVSPQTLDHLTGLLFGGFGRTLSQVYERGQEPKAGDIPVISQLADPAMRRLVREPSPFASVDDFHDLQRAIRVERDRAKEDRRLMPASLGALMKEGNALEELRQRKRKEIDSLEGDAQKVAQREMDRTLQLWIKRARKALLTTPDTK